MRPRFLAAAALMLASLLAPVARAADNLYFFTSDGVRLHLIAAGPPNAQTVILVPGWTMPAWIFQPQIEAFSRRYRVVALDPRGQGDSDVPATGYDQDRRGQDIADLIAAARHPPRRARRLVARRPRRLAYVHQNGDRQPGRPGADRQLRRRGPAPPSRPPARAGGPRVDREVRDAELRPRHVPQQPRRGLPGPPDRHRTAHAARRRRRAAHLPRAAHLLAGRGLVRAQARSSTSSAPASPPRPATWSRTNPLAETDVFAIAGHALFVDEAGRFNAIARGLHPPPGLAVTGPAPRPPSGRCSSSPAPRSGLRPR